MIVSYYTIFIYNTVLITVSQFCDHNPCGPYKDGGWENLTQTNIFIDSLLYIGMSASWGVTILHSVYIGEPNMVRGRSLQSGLYFEFAQILQANQH